VRPAGKPSPSYATYIQAQRAVDALSDAGFPVDKVEIVGHGVRLVERVTGRLTMVITEAAAHNDAVVGLVYVNGFAPEHGESAFELSTKFPGSTLADNLVAYPVATAATSSPSGRTRSTSSSPPTCPPNKRRSWPRRNARPPKPPKVITDSDWLFRWITSPGLPDPVRVFSTTCPTPFRDAHELIASVTHDRMLEVTTAAVDPDRRHPLTDSVMGRADDRSGVVHDLHDLFARYHTDDVLVEVHGQPRTRGIKEHIDAMKAIVETTGGTPAQLKSHPISFGSGEWTCVVGEFENGNRMVTVAKWRDGAIAEEYLWL
jgi:hypothetical protein